MFISGIKGISVCFMLPYTKLSSKSSSKVKSFVWCIKRKSIFIISRQFKAEVVYEHLSVWFIVLVLEFE